MGAGPRQPDPASLIPPEKRRFKVKDVDLNGRRREGKVMFSPVRREFTLCWRGWGGTPRQQVLTPDELSEYLTNEEIARCLAAAIAASATP